MNRPSATPSLPKPIAGAGRCGLVLGECVQGWLPDWQDFLITAPISLAAVARFDPHLGQGSLTVRPAGCVKALAAITRYLMENQVPLCGELAIENPLPRGHGFATSSADIAASLRAVAQAWDLPLSAADISRIAIEIEPTDGVMYREAVVYAHRRGRLLQRLGHLPRFHAMVICDQVGIDTVDYDKHRDDLRYQTAEIARLENAHAQIRVAIARQDLGLLGCAATESARINENFLPKTYFKEMLELVASGLGVGLIAAHSGTALGLLLDPADPDFDRQQETARRELTDLQPDRFLELSNC